MTPEMEARRGEEARQLLEHPLLVEAFETLEREVHAKWAESPSGDTTGREKLWLMLQLNKRVRLHLESLVANGKMAQHTLAQRAKQAVGLPTDPL